MATFVVPRFLVPHAGSLKRPDLAGSSGRSDWTGFRIRAFSGSGGNSSAEDEQAEKARRALESLDQQLNTLSQSNGRVPRKPQPLRTLPGPDGPIKKGSKVEFPELNDSFLVYSAGFLFLLTIVNNVLFKFIFKPDIKPKAPLFPTETPLVMEEERGRKRFRIKSFQEGLEPVESPALTDSSP